MDKVYYITDEPKDVGLLSLIHRGYYRSLKQVHLNIFEGRDLTHGMEKDVIAAEVAHVFIAPMLLEAGVASKDKDGKFSTPYARLVIKDVEKFRNVLLASMEHNVRDMTRHAVTLDDKSHYRSSVYQHKKACDKTITEALSVIRDQFNIILNAPLHDDDSKNTQVELAFVGLKELKNEKDS